MSVYWDGKTARVLFTALMFVAVLAFLHGARGTLTLFMFAILFTYLLEPFVVLLARLLHGRGRAIIATYILLGGAVTVVCVLFGPSLAGEAKDLLTSLPALANRLASGQLISGLVHSRGWTNARAAQIQQFFTDHRAAIISYAVGLAQRLEAPLIHIWWLILIPILSVFFLKDGSSMAATLISVAGRQRRIVLSNIISDVHNMLGSYIRAQLILAALTAVVVTTVLALTHVPYIFVLGPLAGLCEFLPIVGPAVACVAIFGVAALTGYTHLLWVFLFLGTWRTMQDYINAPRIMGRSLEVSPLAEIFAVLAGGEIGGVVGALIAVPILAILRILWMRLQMGAVPEEPSVVGPYTRTLVKHDVEHTPPVSQ